MFATLDIETTGLNRYKDEITWIGVQINHSIEDTQPIVYTFEYSKKLDRDEFLILMQQLKEKKARLIWQNGKFDTLFIEHKTGIRLPISDDIMLMGTAYELNDKHNLKYMAQKYLHVSDWDISTKDKTKGSAEVIEPYLEKDVKYTWELFCYFTRVMDKKQVKTYKKLLLPAYRIYCQIERNGIYINMDEYCIVKKRYEALEADWLKKLTDKYPINWNSSQQKQEVLFTKKGENLPVLKKTPAGKPSGDAAVMKQLAAMGHEIPQMLIGYQKVNTANKMFLRRYGDDAFWDGRIHPSFNLTNVRSGRTSCKEPNLQQCYSKDTEILTEQGFIPFPELKDQKVAQWEENGIITFVEPIRKVKYPVTDELIHIHNQHIELLVTKNHRCLLQNRKSNKFCVVEAQSYLKDARHLHAGMYQGGSIQLDPDLITLIVAAQADATISYRRALRFCFSKQRKIDRLLNCLDRLDLPYTKFFRKGRNLTEIKLGFESLNFVKPYIDDEKRFTLDLLNLNTYSRKLFLNELRFWDGLSTRSNSEYVTTSRQNADIIQILYTLSNIRSLLCVDESNYRKNKNHSVAYRVYETKQRNYSLTTNCKIGYTPYSDTVYCVEVPSGFIVVRRDGKTSVSGNCPNDPKIRNLFTAPTEDRIFFEADYSQLELRLAAHYAQEPTMMNIYKCDGDIHSETAKIMTGGKEPTKLERKRAKPINFGKI